MTYKIRIRHKVPNKVFPLTLRYDDTSLNLPVIRVNLSDTFQVVELTGWEVIRGFIDPNKVKIEGVVNEGGQVYVVGNVNFTSVVETIEQTVDIRGTVRYEIDVDEIPVNITGIVRYEVDIEEIPVGITGIVRYELDVEEIPVNITGTIRQAEKTSFMLGEILVNNRNDIPYNSIMGYYGEGPIKLSWYYNEDMDESHKFNPRKYMYYNGLSDVYYDEVWFKFEAPDEFMTISPSTGHIVKTDPVANVFSRTIKITANIFEIHAGNEDMEDSGLEIEWYTDSSYSDRKFFTGNGNQHIFITGCDEIWAEVVPWWYYDEYKTKYVHITKDDPIQYVIFDKNTYSYALAITPSGVSPTVEWYKDENCEIPVTSEDGTFDGNYMFSTPLSNLWIKVTSSDFPEKIIAIDGNVNELINVNLYVNVNANLLTLYDSEKETGTGKEAKIHNETDYFPLVISDDSNEPIDYTVSIENTHRTAAMPNTVRGFETASGQINIGNDYSIFICTRQGYGYGEYAKIITTTYGTFTISSNKSEDFKLTASAIGGSQHNSADRFYTSIGTFINVRLEPYDPSSKNEEISIIGIADGAAIISGNTLKYYDDDENTAEDYPSKECIYECHPGYKNTQYENAFDSYEMIDNLSLEVGRKYSYIRFTLLPNTSDRLRFGVIRLVQKDSWRNQCLHFIIQESENIRFMYYGKPSSQDVSSNCNIYTTIDLSKHGNVYELPYISYSTRVFNKLYFMGSDDISNRIYVTNLEGTIEATSQIIETNKLQYTFTTDKEEESGGYHDGFRIQII